MYSLVNVFGTIQGEGALTGTPATFIRLGGCNMWSGVEQHRERDARRNGAECPRWCDTDFRPRAQLTASQIADEVAKHGDRPLIVITGGEPLLQVDDALIMVLREFRARVQIETNGTVLPRFTPWARLWITLSPKLPREKTMLREADELKLVYPAHDPAPWASFPVRAGRFLSPQNIPPNPHSPEWRRGDHEQQAIAYVQANPDWRLTFQSHKMLGVP